MDFDNFALGNTDYGNFMSNAHKILTKKRQYWYNFNKQ